MNEIFLFLFIKKITFFFQFLKNNHFLLTFHLFQRMLHSEFDFQISELFLFSFSNFLEKISPLMSEISNSKYLISPFFNKCLIYALISYIVHIYYVYLTFC